MYQQIDHVIHIQDVSIYVHGLYVLYSLVNLNQVLHLCLNLILLQLQFMQQFQLILRSRTLALAQRSRHMQNTHGAGHFLGAIPEEVNEWKHLLELA